MRRREPRIASRTDIAFMILLFCAIFALYIAVRPLFEAMGDLFLGMLAILLYFALLGLWAAIRLRRTGITVPEAIDTIFETELVAALEQMAHPVLLSDEAERAVFCNRAFLALTGKEIVAAGTHVLSLYTLCEEDGVLIADFEGRRCRTYKMPVSRGDRDYTLYNFYDETERLALARRYAEERAVVAYAIIDNIEEILQFVQDNYAETSHRVEERLREWMASVGGMLRAYDRNKYLLIFDQVYLDECLADRFAILDEIRAIRVGDSMPITVSLGVSHLKEGTLAEREAAAQYALDLALQRGGDQVVLRDDVGVSFFGGRTKAGYKRVNIKARVVASNLLSLIARAGNVLIMGHRFGDYDSFGACVGLARLVLNQGVRVNIVVNRDDENLAPCFERIAGLSEYRGLFVDKAEGLDLAGADTLLIVADVNNSGYVECPELMEKTLTVAVIDHHIKTVDYNSNVKLEYIDSTASSACELVSEIIENSVGGRVLRPEEAELMLSGVLLDTKRFTRNTGTRTFAVAQFLRGVGANPGEAFEFFKTSVSDLEKEARFHTNVLIYRNKIAIAACDGEDLDASYRVAAAKAADGLLGVKGVTTSFALVLIEDTVHISARSDGTVNVQVILEQFDGGGHFDVAGAQLKGMTLGDAVQALRDSIDDYFDKKYKGENV